MEIIEQVNEGGTPSKITKQADANCAVHRWKNKEGEAALYTNPQKSCAGKRKKIYTGHSSYALIGGKTCLLHAPGHSTEGCKVLREYS